VLLVCRKNVSPGTSVEVVQKQHQRTGELTAGVVSRLLTSSSFHPRGIKVRCALSSSLRAQTRWFVKCWMSNNTCWSEKPKFAWWHVECRLMNPWGKWSFSRVFLVPSKNEGKVAVYTIPTSDNSTTTAVKLLGQIAGTCSSDTARTKRVSSTAVHRACLRCALLNKFSYGEMRDGKMGAQWAAMAPEWNQEVEAHVGSRENRPPMNMACKSLAIVTTYVDVWKALVGEEEGALLVGDLRWLQQQRSKERYSRASWRPETTTFTMKCTTGTWGLYAILPTWL